MAAFLLVEKNDRETKNVEQDQTDLALQSPRNKSLVTNESRTIPLAPWTTATRQFPPLILTLTRI